ncbi:MAG: hypothetical protein ACI8SR_002682 [Oceanicoccus sp.]|jgi:hypothetical protein
MKHLLLLFVVLTGCNSLTQDESALVGKWEWQERESGHGLSGYVALYKDRTYECIYQWQIKVEQLSEQCTERHELQNWQLENTKLCLYGMDQKAKHCSWQVLTEKSRPPRLFLVRDQLSGKELTESIEAYKVEH